MKRATISPAYQSLAKDAERILDTFERVFGDGGAHFVMAQCSRYAGIQRMGALPPVTRSSRDEGDTYGQPVEAAQDE